MDCIAKSNLEEIFLEDFEFRDGKFKTFYGRFPFTYEEHSFTVLLVFYQNQEILDSELWINELKCPIGENKKEIIQSFEKNIMKTILNSC